MVDMATKYDEYPEHGSEFSLMRDSLYILCIMNQYSPKPSLPPVEAERLLRLALFSNLLPLNRSADGLNLVKRRTELAQNFREGRKKGVVPVFISFLWFVFALALSIQLAYGEIGGNLTAHNLALGFVVSSMKTVSCGTANHDLVLTIRQVGWLPIFILASTVDRNLVSADSICERLNTLLDDVRCALLDPEVLADYMQLTRTTEEDYFWTECLSDEDLFSKNFFQGFAGQGRTVSKISELVFPDLRRSWNYEMCPKAAHPFEFNRCFATEMLTRGSLSTGIMAVGWHFLWLLEYMLSDT